LRLLSRDRRGNGPDEQDLQLISGGLTPASAPSLAPQVELAVETAVAETADKLPSRWGNAVRDNVSQSEEHLVAVLDRKLATVDLELSPPPWWWLATVAQYLFGLATVIGTAWLLLLGVATVIDSDVVGSATMLGVPASLLMVVLGLLGGAVLTALCAWLLTVGARRRRLLVQERLIGAVREVAEEQVMTPIRAGSPTCVPLTTIRSPACAIMAASRCFGRRRCHRRSRPAAWLR
jgi:hypothetical protein